MRVIAGSMPVIAAALLGGALLVDAGSAAAASCFGVRATIVGTKHNDHILATSGRDVIAGLGGDDRISGLGNRDRICTDSNLTARLNGKPVHLPPGTYSALVGVRGLQPLGG